MDQQAKASVMALSNFVDIGPEVPQLNDPWEKTRPRDCCPGITSPVSKILGETVVTLLPEKCLWPEVMSKFELVRGLLRWTSDITGFQLDIDSSLFGEHELGTKTGKKLRNPDNISLYQL